MSSSDGQYFPTGLLNWPDLATLNQLERSVIGGAMSTPIRRRPIAFDHARGADANERIKDDFAGERTECYAELAV